MNRTELLNLSEKISVGDSSLRKIYETHLIGERGLRRLVAEYLRGGDIKKALRSEIVEHEIDFERDPAMRDIAPASQSSQNQGGAAQTILNDLVQKASANVGADSEEAAFYRSQAAKGAEEFRKQKQQRQMVDLSFAVIIIVLLSIVVYLAFFR